jgi:oxygen-independent coproporphyrinogen-3 oxidase
MAGIYIHIPFCKQKCTYCDFTSYPKRLNDAEAYIACLYKEIKLRSIELKEKSFDTIYFGGGTPSIIKPEYIAGAIKQIQNCYSLGDNLEITLELNPGTVDEEKIEIYKKSGVNRFSIGLQSGQNYHLQRLNRIHNSEDFLNVCKLLKGENISCDILIGLQNQTEKEIKDTIDLAIEGKVSHISMYALKPEEGTPIFSNYLNGDLPSNDDVAEFYETAIKYLEEKGFKRYEVSNFCKDNKYSKHNLNYWKRGEYIGFGISACSFIDNKRFTNTRDFDDYFKCIISNRYPVVDSEEITENEAEFEYIMLGLRTIFGIDLKKFNDIFKTDFSEKYKNIIKKQANYLEISENCIKIKPEYLFVQNNIIIEFLK